MRGLLEKVGGVAQAVVRNPEVQGLLGAAAIGANPAIGLLAAPFLRAGREQAATARSAAEQELELQALEIAAARRRNQALERIPGLLSGASAIPDEFVGPPRPGMVRESDRQPALLSAMVQAAGPAAMPTLLSRAFPQQGQPSRLQERIAAIREFTGQDPTAAQILEMTGAAPPSQSPQDRLAELRYGLEAEAAAEADEQKRRDQLKMDARYRGLANEALAVSSALDSLDDTILRPGSGEASDTSVRAVLGLLASGLSAANYEEEAEALRAVSKDYDLLGKALPALRNSYVQLDTGEGATNRERSDSAEAFPSAGSEPGAIRKGAAMVLRRLATVAEIDGVSPEVLEYLNTAIEQMAKGSTPATVESLTESGNLVILPAEGG